MKKKYKMPAIGLACVCLAVCAAVILKNHSTGPKVQPQLVDTENRMLLEDFFDSGETSAVRHIYYWFNYQKFELTADPQDIERVLAVLKESGYKKLPEEEAPNSAFRRFELVTDSKKYFLGVSETNRPYIAFGGNQYIADQNILSKIANMEGLEHWFVNSENRQRAAQARVVEETKMLIELFRSGDTSGVSEIDCWRKGNLYKLTDDPQTIQWFMHALHPDNITRLEQDDWAGGFPGLGLEAVVNGERYDFSVGGEYLYIGESQFMDDGEVYRKIREIDAGIFASDPSDGGLLKNEDDSAWCQYIEPGKEMELADFLDSQEAAAATQINYWVGTEKHTLTATQEGSRVFLDVLRESGYKKADIHGSDELESMFRTENFDVFEILTGGKKYFLGVSGSDPGCLAFGGNHYIADRNIHAELMHADRAEDRSGDSSDGEKAEAGRGHVSTLSEFYADGGREEIWQIVCWSWGNLYWLTDDAQTIRWFVEKLNPDGLAETETLIKGDVPELSLAMVAEDKIYIFHVNESYISMGDEPLADDGSIYRKIQEISGWDLES